MVQFRRLALLWLCTIQSIAAIDVDWTDPESIKDAAATIAAGMMSYYVGNEYGQTPGILPAPYYWWEAGAMWGSLVNYWHYTNDTTYNDLTMQALQWQVGPHDDFMPPNASASLGNDDQAFWGMAALQAAEYKFPNPLETQPSWLSLAQAVFNEQTGRWDTKTCNGGIRWQIYEITGYNLKNSISNGCLFNIASRLARYTGDDMYSDWAEEIWDWMWRIGLIDTNYNVYDNTEADILNCTTIDHAQWTYNAGTMLMGASTMWNITQSDIWKNRTSNLLSTLVFDFFPDGIMKDICEQNNACDVDQRSFKAYLSRWMTAATQMAPFTAPIIQPLLLSSAKAATAQCVGAPTGNVCGLKWYNNGTWDGTAGVGQQMAALEVVLGTLVGMTTGAVTNSTGGTSPSNPSAGYNASSIPPGQTITPPTKADKVGAWFLTALWIVMTLWVWWFMNSRGWERRGDRPTVGGKAGRRGRTVSTFEMGATNGVSLASTAARLSYANGVALVHEVSPSDEAGKADERDEKSLPLHTERPLSSRNTLTKPDRTSTFSSTGVFPSDRNAKSKSQLHVRAQSYFGAGERRGSRALPPIHERERGRGEGGGVRGGCLTGGGGVGGGGGKEEGKEKETRGSRFKEEISGESESRLD